MKQATKRRLGVTSLLLIGTAAAWLGVTGLPSRAEGGAQVSTATVTRGEVSTTVTGSGSVVDRYTYAVAADGSTALVAQAGVSVGSGAGAAGYKTVRLDVAAGERVSKGDVLAVVKDSLGDRNRVKTSVGGRIRSVTTAPDATAGQLVTLGSGGQLIELTVSEYDVTSLAKGQKVQLSLESTDSRFSGHVRSVAQTAQSTSGVQEYEVLVSSKNIPENARIGMSVTAEIETASKRNVLTIPASAVQQSDGSATVQVLNADGTTAVVPVELGIVGESEVEVISGLQEGDRVVTGTQGTVPDTSTSTGFPGGAAPGAGFGGGGAQ